MIKNTKKREKKKGKKLFRDYSDVVNLKQMREVLGGMCIQVAIKLLKENKIKLLIKKLLNDGEIVEKDKSLKKSTDTEYIFA